MFKFVSMVFLVVLAFFAGRIYGSQPPSAPINIPVKKGQPTEEMSYTRLSNEEIMALIRETRQQPNSFSKMTKMQALMNILRARGIIQ